MNPLEYIQQFNSNIMAVACMLKELSYPPDRYPLPSIDYLNNLIAQVLSIHPADIIAKLAWENYADKERFIVDSIKGYLEIDADIWCVVIDGNQFYYWDMMNQKLSLLTEKMEQAKAFEVVRQYTDSIVRLSNILHDITNAMRREINYLFKKTIFEDRCALALIEAEADTSTPVITDSVIDTSTGATPATGGTAPEWWRLLKGVLDSDRAREYFGRAIERGWMRPTATGFKWMWGGERGGKAILGYFIEKVYCPNNTENIPEQAVNRLFSTSRIGSAITQLHTAKKPQPWREKIDKLFDD